MSQWTDEEVQKTLNLVTRKSGVDPQFRKLCLNDPKAAIAVVNDTPIPATFRLRFVENEGASMTVILPDPSSLENELTDADLEHVAGGKSGTGTPGGITGGITVGVVFAF